MPPFGTPVTRAQGEAEAEVARQGARNLLSLLQDLDIQPPKISGKLSLERDRPQRDAQYIRVSEALKDPKRWKIPAGGGEDAYRALTGLYAEAVEGGMIDPSEVVLVDDFYGEPEKPLQPTILDSALTGYGRSLGIGGPEEHFDPNAEFADDPVMRNLYKAAGAGGSLFGMFRGLGLAQKAIPQITAGRPLLNEMLRGGAGFGLYSGVLGAGGLATGDTTPGEYATDVGISTALGVALPGMRAAVGAKLPALTQTPTGRFAADAATFGGITRATGGSEEDAVISGLLGPLMMRAAGYRPGGGPRIPTLSDAPASEPMRLLSAPEPARPRPRNASRMRTNYTGRQEGGLAEKMGVPRQEPIITPPPPPPLLRQLGGLTSGGAENPAGTGRPPEIPPLLRRLGGVTESGAENPPGPGRPPRPPEMLARLGGMSGIQPPAEAPPRTEPTLFFKPPGPRTPTTPNPVLPVAPRESVPQEYVKSLDQMSMGELWAERGRLLNEAGAAKTLAEMSPETPEFQAQQQGTAEVARAKADVVEAKLASESRGPSSAPKVVWSRHKDAEDAAVYDRETNTIHIDRPALAAQAQWRGRHPDDASGRYYPKFDLTRQQQIKHELAHAADENWRHITGRATKGKAGTLWAWALAQAATPGRGKINWKGIEAEQIKALEKYETKLLVDKHWGRGVRGAQEGSAWLIYEFLENPAEAAKEYPAMAKLWERDGAAIMEYVHSAAPAEDSKDIFLGFGLGGAQKAYESLGRRPLDVEAPSPPDVPLAKGAYEYATTGNIDAILPVLPASRVVGGRRQYGHMQYPPAAGGGLAIRRTGKPTFRPAKLPDAVLAEIKAAPDLGSELPRHLQAIAAREAFLSGEARTLQAVFGGKYHGPGVEYTQRTLEQIRHAQMARLDRQLDEVARNLLALAPDIIKNPRLREIIPEIPMTSADAQVPTAELLKRPEIQNVVGPKRPKAKRGAAKLKDLSPKMQGQAVRAARIARIWFDKGRDEGLRLRRHQGRRGFGKIDSYWPYMQKVGAQEASGNLGDGMPDFLHPREVESRHTKHRPETELAMRERDPLVMMARYAQAMNKDWAHTAAIGHLKPVIEAFKAADKPVSAAALQRLSDDFYGGKRHPLDRLSDGFASTTAGYYVRGFARMGSRGLTRQALGGNIKFNLGTQPASALLVDARVDPRAAAWAKVAMFDPRWRKLALQTHAARVKQRTGGQVSRQDTSDLDAAKELFLSPMERFSRAILQGFTDFMEKNLNIYSALGGFKDGKLRDLSDREAWDYGSTLVAEAQAMYNQADRAGMLNARDIGLVGRFMTFPTEMGNWARTMNLPGMQKIIGRTGAYNEMAPGFAKKARLIGMMFAVTVLQNLFHESFWGRGLWGLTSYVSFLNTFTPEAGEYNKGTVIGQFYWELAKGIDAVLDDRGFGPLLKWAGNYFLPAGAQIKRTGGTLAALSSGKANIRGTEVRVSSDSFLELIDTLLFGPYHFDEARKEIRRQEREKGKGR